MPETPEKPPELTPHSAEWWDVQIAAQQDAVARLEGAIALTTLYQQFNAAKAVLDFMRANRELVAPQEGT